MNKIKNTREVLKNIPSIDQIIKKFVNSDLSIPIDFLKFHLNKELNAIRNEFKKGLSVKNPKNYIDERILTLYNKISKKSLRPIINGRIKLIK